MSFIGFRETFLRIFVELLASLCGRKKKLETFVSLARRMVLYTSGVFATSWFYQPSVFFRALIVGALFLLKIN